MLVSQVFMFGVHVKKEQVFKKIKSRNCNCDLDNNLLSFKFCAKCGNEIYQEKQDFIVSVDNKDFVYYQSINEETNQEGVVGATLSTSYSVVSNKLVFLSIDEENKVIENLREIFGKSFKEESVGYHSVAVSVDN